METNLPSFSIFIETANLRLAKVGRLRTALESISRQKPSPHSADEVALLEDGNLPEAVLEELCREFSWLKIYRIPEGQTYGDQKALGANNLESEVIVFADPDCIYRQDWLFSLLRTFVEYPEVGAVAGETTIPITGPFTFSAALFYFFPRFSGDRDPAPARGMYFNNVAIRRRTLATCPINLGLQLRGGQNVIYSRQLMTAHIPILRQPLAQCEHAPPESVWMAMKILYWTGRDTARFDNIILAHIPFAGDYEPYNYPGGRLTKLILRLKDISRNESAMLIWFPMAVPILCLVFGAFFAGRSVERLLKLTDK